MIDKSAEQGGRPLPATDAATLPAPRLPLGRYRLAFESEGPLALRGYQGSAWRGLLGHALKQLVCVTRDRECRDCMLYRSCVYSYVFETPPPLDTGKLTKYTAAPHPFLFSMTEPPEERRFLLRLTLFGRGNQYLAYIIHALRTAGEKGLRGGPPLRIAEVEQEATPGGGQWERIFANGAELTPRAPRPALLPPCPEGPLRIDFVTPLRLRHGEHYVTPERFEPSDLLRNLLRRVSLLTYFHTDTPLETDFRRLTDLARAVRLTHRSLQWRDWTRYSGRQKTTLEMGGLVGWIELDTRGLAPLWPYLHLGQWTHAGKGTAMGLGEYRITTGKLANPGDGAGSGHDGDVRLIRA